MIGFESPLLQQRQLTPSVIVVFCGFITVIFNALTAERLARGISPYQYFSDGLHRPWPYSNQEPTAYQAIAAVLVLYGHHTIEVLVLGFFPQDFSPLGLFRAGLFPYKYSPLSIFPAGLFPTRSFPSRFFPRQVFSTTFHCPSVFSPSFFSNKELKQLKQTKSNQAKPNQNLT